MRSHIQQVRKVKHIAQFGKFACDITNIFIAGFTSKLRSNDKNTRIWLDRFKFANDFAHIAEERIGVILRTFCVNVLDASQRMSEDKRIVVAQRNDIRLIPLPKSVCIRPTLHILARGHSAARIIVVLRPRNALQNSGPRIPVHIGMNYAAVFVVAFELTRRQRIPYHSYLFEYACKTARFLDNIQRLFVCAKFKTFVIHFYSPSCVSSLIFLGLSHSVPVTVLRSSPRVSPTNSHIIAIAPTSPGTVKPKYI